jgi:hypothetical protein
MVLFPEKDTRKPQRASSSDKPIPVKIFEGFFELAKILTGIGLSEEEARCSLRVSFSGGNTIEDVDLFLKEFSIAYQGLYPTFREKYSRN